MSRFAASEPPARPGRVRLFACLALLTALAACGSQQTYHARVQYSPSRYYPPPGPPNDPWGPYIREASGRFGIPEAWIRGVMHQESGGQEDVISWAGAVGLMQVMPDTYAGLRERYNLGDDPFDPHNNILAGTAYLREMYDRFGSPGFLAAYNAGPNRVDRYLNDGTPLPAETVNYVASIAPRLGPGTPMSGPLAVYAGTGQGTQFAAQATPAGCDPDAAYNPDGPCTPLQPAVEQSPVIVAAAAPARVYAASAECDPDAAYDPTRPCQPLPQAPVSEAPMSESRVSEAPMSEIPVSQAPLAAPPRMAVAESSPQRMPVRRSGHSEGRRPIQETMALPVAFESGPPPGRWAIQVGAFSTLSTAEAAATNARATLPELLRTAKIELPATAPLGTHIAFRARLSGLSPAAAADACSRLNGRGTACITVPPEHDAF